MVDLDETDLDILSLLTEDARRPYSDVADAVDLSGPAVSDRVTRLREAGVIERFTIDVDRSQLRGGVSVFVRASLDPGSTASVRETVADSERVEHVFVTADGDLWFSGRAPADDVRAWAADLLAADAVTDYDVTLLDGAEWTPTLGGTAFALTCAECGNTVTAEGEAVRVGGDRYHFCCPSCRSRFEERYERLDADA
jgi:DNA-binding Lrp family transcriptional regulator